MQIRGLLAVLLASGVCVALVDINRRFLCKDISCTGNYGYDVQKLHCPLCARSVTHVGCPQIFQRFLRWNFINVKLAGLVINYELTSSLSGRLETSAKEDVCTNQGHLALSRQCDISADAW